MLQALDVAKYFMKSSPVSYQDTLDSNIKLQKMLFFAQLVSLSERQEPLFSDEIHAFEHGCVVESIRLRYRNNYKELQKESLDYHPSFSDSEYNVLNLTTGIFGSLSSKELSELNHALPCWCRSHERSECRPGYHEKNLSIIPTEELLAEVEKVKSVIDAYRTSRSDGLLEKVIQGVTFSYASDFEMTDEVIQELEEFAQDADDNAYSVYLDDGELVVY